MTENNQPEGTVSGVTPGPWFVVRDTSQQDEFGNGPIGVAISVYEDDVPNEFQFDQ